jgi:hypothetical protein
MSLEITSEMNGYLNNNTNNDDSLFEEIKEQMNLVFLGTLEKESFEVLKDKKLAKLQADYDASPNYDSLAELNEYINQCVDYVCFSSMIDEYKKLSRETREFNTTHKHLVLEEHPDLFKVWVGFREKHTVLTEKIRLFGRPRGKYDDLHRIANMLNAHYLLYVL